MTFDIRTLVAATFALAALAAPASAQSFSPDQRGEIEKIVREYLLSNPQLLQEVMTELEKRQQLAEVEKHRAAIKEHAEIIFDSPRQVTIGNPKGDVTFVELFDYNCGYCKRAMTDMLDLMKADPKIKVVLKEFPVLGEGSTQAAQVAVAVRMQDKTGGKKYLEFHQKLREAYLKLAKSEPDRCVLVDARGDRKVVAEQIWELVNKRLDPAMAPLFFEDVAS